MRPVHLLAALAGVLAALVLGLTTGVGGIGGVATACAQEPPPIPFPTFGPLDPSCNGVPDTDNDGVLDYEDNCQGYYNPAQADTDSDAGEPPYEPVNTNTRPRDPTTGGDTCDTDDDGDTVPDSGDNCPKVPNKEQGDADTDGKGDVCDPQPNAPAAPAATASSPAAGTQGSSAAAAAPKLTVVGLSRRQHLAELQAGLAVSVRCSAACAVTGALRVGSRSAGSGRASLDDAGMTFVFVKLSRAARRSVARSRRGARATLRLTVADRRGGHRSAVTRRLTLSR